MYVYTRGRLVGIQLYPKTKDLRMYGGMKVSDDRRILRKGSGLQLVVIIIFEEGKRMSSLSRGENHEEYRSDRKHYA